ILVRLLFSPRRVFVISPPDHSRVLRREVMEEVRGPTEAHLLHGPHRNVDPEVPAGFAPLHLMLEPAGLWIEVHRPEAIVGRHSSADVRLALPDISRRHCRL